MDRRLFLENVGLLLGGVALDQLGVIERLTWKRTFFPTPFPRPYARITRYQDGVWVPYRNVLLHETPSGDLSTVPLQVVGEALHCKIDVILPKEVVYAEIRKHGWDDATARTIAKEKILPCC